MSSAGSQNTNERSDKMIKSMTAFGRAVREFEDKTVTVEVRSVNSRFFDCTVRLPRRYSYLEEKIKAYIQKNAVSRAKVDVYVGVDSHVSQVGSIGIDTAYARSYIDALRTLRDEFGLSDDITVMSVARNQDIFVYGEAQDDEEEEWGRFSQVLEEALSGYRAMREAEGERTLLDMKTHLENVRQCADRIAALAEENVSGYRGRLESRLRSIIADNSVEMDENRILTECALWADKLAVDEELARLASHFDAFYDIAALPEPSGRKLDFLIQELNRETNTIGSKASNSDIARIVVDMKSEIEKIREQVQNVE